MSRLSKSTDSNIRVLITTGDSDGIGWEVTAKALNSLGPVRGVQFCYFRTADKGPRLSGRFKREVVKSLREATLYPSDSKYTLEIQSGEPPARWVEESASACLSGKFQALVTAPLSKTSITRSGMKDIGHTEILQRVSGVNPLFMGFIGGKFSVLLATGHAPLRQALHQLNLSHMAKVMKAAQQMRQVLPAARQKLPFALLGVNPHAGEDGLIGIEEGWMTGFIEEQRRRGERVIGPLVPDAAFLPKNWPLFSLYICPYHDQGLIPFKMIHGFKSGVHLTLGLPFVRTSVDHGTAKELYGRNKAEAGSMKDAIKTAIRLARSKT